MTNAVRIYVNNLDNGDVCYAGQTITGRVECNFDQAKKLKEVRITFQGKCNTSWSNFEKQYDTFHKESKSKNICYRAEEVYFLHTYALVGGGTEFTLPAGRYTYPFSYILPQLLPSYFTNDLGKVIYTIKATVDYPWKFNDNATVMLKLVSPLDLNSFPQLRQPVEVSADKTLFTWSFKNSDPLTFTMSLPISAYAVGQQVKVNACVRNMTHVSVEKVIFKIVKLIEFITHYPKTAKKYVDSVLVSCTEKGIGAHGEKCWTSSLPIPTDDSCPNMVHCKLINISYELQGELVVPFPHTNLSACVPLVIGHLPLLDVNIGRPILQTNVDHPYPSAPPLQDFDTSALPTYEEVQRRVTAPTVSSTPQYKLSREDSFEMVS